jgi:HK97 family phage prohead protease
MNKLFNISIVRSDNLGPLNAVGIATREVPDYADDIVVVSGMQSRNADVVLLANHDPSKPIGRARLSESGIEVKAYITFAPEGTTPTADEYRKLCKAGVLTDLSIGFNPIERQMIDGGGWRYTKWQCLEVSLVAIGCNPEAIIVQRSQKSGRVLSGANAAKLKSAHDFAEQCRSIVKDVLDGADCDDDDDDCDDAKAARLRQVEVLSLNAEPYGDRIDRLRELRRLEVVGIR